MNKEEILKKHFGAVMLKQLPAFEEKAMIAMSEYSELRSRGLVDALSEIKKVTDGNFGTTKANRGYMIIKIMEIATLALNNYKQGV